MCTVKQMMRRFKRLDVPVLAAESMRDTKQDFVEWQQEQLFAGETSKGTDIKPFYRPATVRIKKKKGQPTDRVTLKDTGFFHKSIYLSVRPGDGTFKVVSSDVKSTWLMEKYGENIFGLGGIYKKFYVEDLRPVFIGKIKQQLKVL